jgi:hypothetical protein
MKAICHFQCIKIILSIPQRPQTEAVKHQLAVRDIKVESYGARQKAGCYKKTSILASTKENVST